MAKPSALKQRRLTVEKLRQEGVLPGVKAASMKEVLEREAQRPLYGQDKPLGADSLFGDGFKQKELFS